MIGLHLSVRHIWLYVTIQCGFTLKLVRDMITYNQMRRTDKYSQHSSIIWQVWLNGWLFVYGLSGCGFESCYCHLNFRYGACFNIRRSLTFRQTIEGGFTLKLVRDMIITYGQMRRTDTHNTAQSFGQFG